MLISEISIKNFKSFGNATQTLKLNTEKGQLILLSGNNGNGKSVVKDTEIEIKVDFEKLNTEETNIFHEITDNKKQIISIAQLNELQNKLGIIDKKLVSVSTENGFKKVKAIGITSPNSTKIKIKTKDFILIGSPSHRVKYKNNWNFLKDIKENDYVNTKNGIQKIISVNNDDNKEDLWDIEVEGSEYFSNGILSHNSSLISSFDFCLYGKSKGTKKKWTKLSTLPNRINQTDMLVDLSFKSSNMDVNIKRGISPNILELKENDILDEKAGKSNIESKIAKHVGMDIETFKSFISMSINDFKNFISLSTEEKKILLDKLFNLEVINILGEILKDINRDNKKRMASVDAEIKTLDESITSIKNSIKKSIEKENLNRKKEIDELNELINSKKEEYKTLKEKVDKIKSKEKQLEDELDKEKTQLINTKNDIRTVDKEISLYDSGKCPTCSTDFNTQHFIDLRNSLVEKKDSYQEILKEIETNIANVKKKKTKLDKISDDVNSSFNDLRYLLKDYKKKIDDLNNKEKRESKDSINIKEFQDTVEELKEKKSISNEKSSEYKEKELYYKELNRILSADGVKKSIISGIIKPINKFISQNIEKMGLPFQVQLDETFNADIKSLGSSIEHDSLSTGETKLLNLCILIAYLKLIRTKKQNINILFLDEVFSSIDLNNIDKITGMLKDFAEEYNINIFVVHHAILAEDMFDRIIKLNKDVFSTIEEKE